MGADRATILRTTKMLAARDGKATATYTNPYTNITEQLTYVKRNGRIELAELTTDAEELYPPFEDKRVYKIRYREGDARNLARKTKSTSKRNRMGAIPA